MKRYIKSAIKNPLNEDVSVQEQIARDSTTRPDILSQLYYNNPINKSSFDWYHILFGLAGNPNTPQDILVELADYLKIDCHEALAGNPSTPPELLHRLASDRDYRVKYKIAENPSTTTETLLKLMRCKVSSRHFWERLLLNILDRDDLDPKVEARANALYQKYCP